MKFGIISFRVSQFGSVSRVTRDLEMMNSACMRNLTH